MFEHFSYFDNSNTIYSVATPFCLDDLIGDWADLQKKMIRSVPPEFSRDEWAYLAIFLSVENLLSPFVSIFGSKKTGDARNAGAKAGRVIIPRGNVALWLPNNVSLLGPLMLILLSLSGNRLDIKSGSRSSNLTRVFLSFALANLKNGSLKEYLGTVKLESFSRDDPKNSRMASKADVRIIFGSDEAACAIEALNHPVNSSGIYFTNKVSEVWIDLKSINSNMSRKLLKVFAIYGQSGCTSPKRVVIIGGSRTDAQLLCSELAKLWTEMFKDAQEQHVASENIMAAQWAKALGMSVEISSKNGAIFASGNIEVLTPSAKMILGVTWAEFDEAVKSLPENIQTIGYALEDNYLYRLQSRIASSNIKRVVPIAQMHHFSHIWDGINFFRQLFEEKSFR